MGLLDVLNGMQNGPRGLPQPSAPGSGGMSKITMALLAFLAYKAFKGSDTSIPAPSGAPSRSGDSPTEPGGLAGVLRTIFGGGSLPGNVITRGVGNAIHDLDRSGHGDIARSWVASGPNRSITADQLEAGLGEEGIRDLMERTGMERSELLAALSEHLPRVIDHLTPDGRLPSDQEASRLA